MLTAIPRASRSPPPRWPPSPSNVTRSMASGTTPSHPTSSRHEAVIPRQILTAPGAHDGRIESLEKAGAIGSREGLGPAGDLAHPAQVLADAARRQSAADVGRGEGATGRMQGLSTGFEGSVGKGRIGRDHDITDAGPPSDPV